LQLRKSAMVREIPEGMRGPGAGLLPGNVWDWLIFLFIVGIMTLSHFKGFSTIMIGYVVVLGLLSLIFMVYGGRRIPLELVLYVFWILWSLGGLLNVRDLSLFYMGFFKAIQIGLIIMVIAGSIGYNRRFSILMGALLLGGTILSVSSIYTGEMQQVSELESFRAEGYIGNANDFAYYQMFVLFAIFYFIRFKRKLVWRIFFLSLTVLPVSAIVWSGSRKAFLGVFAFVFFWIIFCQTKKITKSGLKAYVLLMLLFTGAYFATDYVISNTFLGKRLEQISRNEKRVELYKEGFTIIKKNPVFGVGLDNFRTISRYGLFSHSDYIEVASATGLVGFFLYFSIFWILWRRLGKIKRRARDPDLLYFIGLAKASIIVILLLALGRVNMNSKLTWIFLAGIIGYSWSVQKYMRASERNAIRNSLHSQ
jgi:O-antigen ligase